VIELKEVLEAGADWAGWGWHECDDGSIELENWSPAGENLIVTLKGKDIVREMTRYSADFDVDEHVAPLVEIKGTRGVPDSILVLVEDAKEIEEMLDTLAGRLQLAEADFRAGWLKEVTKEEANDIIETREPRGAFLCMEGDVAVGIDNGTGDAWTEEFRDRIECLKWLLGWSKEMEEDGTDGDEESV